MYIQYRVVTMIVSIYLFERGVRWNATYMMIERANKLRDSLCRMCIRCRAAISLLNISPWPNRAFT